jgi:predicted NUDIX family NTP pyrophosphohydrolase
MPKRSAALLLYRRGEDGKIEVLLGHMGGPFWAKKDARGWSIPKGEYTDDEDPLAAARREFTEEIGAPPPDGETISLGECRQSTGKVITTYAIEGDYDLDAFHSNTFELEWPRGSGRVQEFPEIDRAEWMGLDRAAEMLVKGQLPIIEALGQRVGADGPVATVQETK